MKVIKTDTATQLPHTESALTTLSLTSSTKFLTAFLASEMESNLPTTPSGDTIDSYRKPSQA